MLVFSIIAVDGTGQDSMVLATSCIPCPQTAQLPNCPPTAEESVPGTKLQEPKPQPKSRSLHHSLNHRPNYKGDFLSPRNVAGECEASPRFRKAEIDVCHHVRRPRPKPQNPNHKVDLSCPRTAVPGFREVEMEVYDQLRRPLTSPRSRHNF
jgi:hypothetical protein